MSTYTDKMTLLETLQHTRARWDDLVGQVPAEKMGIPGAAGAWSLKEVIVGTTFRHYEDHFPAIEALLGQLEAL